MDDPTYFQRLESRNDAYEALCRRCGVCCGATTDDPCSQLKAVSEGAYVCSTYDKRHGPQLSVKGNMFACVNIRDAIRDGADYPDCPYCRGSV